MLQTTTTANITYGTAEERLDPESFCFWLQGFIEMSGATSINEEQMKVLKEHLELVFKKVAVHTHTPQPTFTPGTLFGPPPIYTTKPLATIW